MQYNSAGYIRVPVEARLGLSLLKQSVSCCLRIYGTDHTHLASFRGHLDVAHIFQWNFVPGPEKTCSVTIDARDLWSYLLLLQYFYLRDPTFLRADSREVAQRYRLRADLLFDAPVSGLYLPKTHRVLVRHVRYQRESYFVVELFWQRLRFHSCSTAALDCASYKSFSQAPERGYSVSMSSQTCSSSTEAAFRQMLRGTSVVEYVLRSSAEPTKPAPLPSRRPLKRVRSYSQSRTAKKRSVCASSVLERREVRPETPMQLLIKVARGESTTVTVHLEPPKKRRAYVERRVVGHTSSAGLNTGFSFRVKACASTAKPRYSVATRAVGFVYKNSRNEFGSLRVQSSNQDFLYFDNDNTIFVMPPQDGKTSPPCESRLDLSYDAGPDPGVSSMPFSYAQQAAVRLVVKQKGR